MHYHLYLIRHGQTAGNRCRQYIGVTDEPLCADGVNELEASKRSGRYPDVGFVYVSPMRRCLETKDIIYPEKPFCVVPDLKECDFGLFEQKTYDDLKDDQDYRKWLNQEQDFCFPGGENPLAFVERCGQGFAEIVAEVLAKDIRHSAVIIHGGTIMSILDRYAQCDKKFFDWHTKNGRGYHVLIEKDSWLETRRISAVNALWPDEDE